MSDDIERFKMWLNSGLAADDFRPTADSPEHQAFRHMWRAVSIVLEEGKGLSGVLHLLSRVIYEMEDEEEDA